MRFSVYLSGGGCGGDADALEIVAPDPKPKKNRELKTEILPIATPYIATSGGSTPTIEKGRIVVPILEKAAVVAKAQLKS